MGKWRLHSLEFKRAAVARMKGCDNIHELARALGVERKLLYTWKWQFEGRPEPKHANYGSTPAEETAETRLREENRRLKEALGQKAAELDFFAAALRKVSEDLQQRESGGDPASMPRSGRKTKRRAK